MTDETPIMKALRRHVWFDLQRLVQLLGRCLAAQMADVSNIHNQGISSQQLWRDGYSILALILESLWLVEWDTWRGDFAMESGIIIIVDKIALAIAPLPMQNFCNSLYKWAQNDDSKSTKSETPWVNAKLFI
jgi:hypothetical protein